MTRIRLALLLALAMSLPVAAFADNPHSAVRRGLSHYDREEYDKALAEFLAGVQLAPDRPETRYDHGTALYKLQNYPQAAESFARAAEKGEKLSPDAWFNLGNSLFKAGKMPESVGAYKNALRLNHQDKDAKHNLEMALRAMQMQQQQPQQGNQQKQQQQKQDQQQQQKQDQQKQQPAQAQPDSARMGQDSTAQKQPQKPGEMTKEEALQILQAMENDEQEAQKDKLIRQFGEPRRGGKDW